MEQEEGDGVEDGDGEERLGIGEIDRVDGVVE